MYMFETFLNSIPKNRSEFVNELEIPEVTVTPYIWCDLEDSITTRSDSVSLVTLNVTEEVEDKSLNTESSVPLTRAMTDSDIDYDRYKRFKHRRYSDPWDLMKATNDAFPTDYLDSLYRHGRYRYYDGSWSKYLSDSYIPWSTYYRYGLLPTYKYDVPLPKYRESYKYEPLSTYRSTYSSSYDVPRYSYYRYGLPSYNYSWRYSYLKPWRYSYSYLKPWRYSYSYLKPWRYSYQTTSDYVDDVLKESRLHRYEYNEKLRQKMKQFFDDDCNVFSADDPGLTRLEEALLDLDYKDDSLNTDNENDGKAKVRQGD